MNDALRLLCVEDDPFNLEILEKLLLDEVYEPITFTEAVTAWSYLKKHGDQIDIALLDCKLPVMDGLELARRMQSNTACKHIPIIFVSAHIHHMIDNTDALDSVFATIQKPFDRDELYDVIRNAQQHLAQNKAG